MRIYQGIKNLYHLLQAVGACLFFGFPSRKIKIIGVTGTNGKTTTVWMINKILQEAGYKTAVSSTINFKIGQKEWVNKTKFTTLSAWKVQQFIKKAVDAECDYLVMETSSHALDQNRVWGVDYDVAVITNITREHLDYHGDMESYKNAKKKLFDIIQNSKFKSQNYDSKLKTYSLTRNTEYDENRKSKIENRKSIVVNLGMQWAEEFLAVEADEKYGYLVEISNDKLQIPNKPKITNIKNQNHNEKQKTIAKSLKINTIEAKSIKLKIDGSEFSIDDFRFSLTIPGRFNVENALAAVCAGLSQNINLETCAKALEKIKKIPGRMDYVENKRGLKIIIDYAVTPDSMEKLGQLVSEIKKKSTSCHSQLDWEPSKKTEKKNAWIPAYAGMTKKPKIIWVFGACGERDRGKRPMMGTIGAKYADVVIVTNEDPYGEDEHDIINQVLSGIVDGTDFEDSTNSKLKIPNSKSNLKSQIQNNSKFQITKNYNSKLTAGDWAAFSRKTKKSNKEKYVDKIILKIIDRKEAIKKALGMAKEGDIVLITGKGAEETMAVGKKRIPWNDRVVVEKILKEI